MLFAKWRCIATVALLSCVLTTQAYAEKIDGKHEADTAEVVGRIKVAKSPEGFFFRGDSRRPESADGQGIFDIGFQPQGNNPSLIAHLSFRGDSGYVATSRSDIAAQRYMFGRTGSGNSEGYLYVIAPDQLPNGYWIPGLYPNDPAVRANQEFAVYSGVPANNIAGAFHYAIDANTPIEWIPNPNYAYSSTSAYNPSRDGFFQDICGAISVIAAYICVKSSGND
jgi:hypothetical protein